MQNKAKREISKQKLPEENPANNSSEFLPADQIDTAFSGIPAGVNVTYMLRCGDGSFYIGWTNNLEKRVKTHQAGRGGKYTSTHLPVSLVYYEIFASKQEAQSREWHMKRLTHRQKEELSERGLVEKDI